MTRAEGRAVRLVRILQSARVETGRRGRVRRAGARQGAVILDESPSPHRAAPRADSEQQPEAGGNTAPPAPEPVRKAFRDPLLLGVLVLALAADQLTKAVVLANLGFGESWPAEGFFRFTFVRNTGTAFGFFQDQSMVMTVVSLVAVALIVLFYRNAAMASPLTRVALGLQVGGAIGNLLDRLRHGYVVDFIDVGPWPVFNVADSAIVTGIFGLLLFFTVLSGRDPERARAPTRRGADAPPAAGGDETAPPTPPATDRGGE